MDSDAKELGHVRVARSKDRFGLPGLECDHAFLRWQQCSQSKIAHDSRWAPRQLRSRSAQTVAPELSPGPPSSTCSEPSFAPVRGTTGPTIGRIDPPGLPSLPRCSGSAGTGRATGTL